MMCRHNQVEYVESKRFRVSKNSVKEALLEYFQNHEFLPYIAHVEVAPSWARWPLDTVVTIRRTWPRRRI
jgi:hypothetical protein